MVHPVRKSSLPTGRQVLCDGISELQQLKCQYSEQVRLVGGDEINFI